MVQAQSHLPCRSVTKWALLLLAGGLAGCASAPSVINPVSWWHSFEGGPIAQKRAPPPGAGQPYPNLANVPMPPAFLPPSERTRISAALLADRTQSQQQALLEPLAKVATTDTNSSLLTPPPAAPPPAPPGAASASMPAVTSMPAASPPAASPPAARPPPTQEPPNQEPTVPASIAAATATLPAVPMAPPPPPALAGIGMPGPPPQPFTAVDRNGVRISFAAGSSVLSVADRARLDGIAHRRHGADIAVMGFGDATQSDPVTQSAALQLGLARAEAVATALVAAGVPESALRLGAQASGTGAAVALVRQTVMTEGEHAGGLNRPISNETLMTTGGIAASPGNAMNNENVIPGGGIAGGPDYTIKPR